MWNYAFSFLSIIWSTQLTDFGYTDFTVSYRDAMDRLRVGLNIILLLLFLHFYTPGSKDPGVKNI